jgi:hypothetical protein
MTTTYEDRHLASLWQVDPLVCLASRELESPEDWAPPCGAWDSDHCRDCSLCPGVHAEDCEMGSDIRCSGCGMQHPWHRPDCGTAANQESDSHG